MHLYPSILANFRVRTVCFLHYVQHDGRQVDNKRHNQTDRGIQSEALAFHCVSPPLPRVRPRS